MAPFELYKIIASAAGATTCSMCEAKAVCVPFYKCSVKSQHEVIDFDLVKNEFCKSKHLKNMASVDGILCNDSNTEFILVEKKSWTQFFEHNTNNKTLHKLVQKELNSYNLNKKYKDSCTICADLANDVNIFAETPHCFVFFTDLDEAVDPIAPLAQDLMLLELGATDPKIEAGKLAKNGIINALSSVSCKKRYFISCKEFDKFVNMLK